MNRTWILARVPMMVAGLAGKPAAAEESAREQGRTLESGRMRIVELAVGPSFP
jgi:hypothetical protein